MRPILLMTVQKKYCFTNEYTVRRNGSEEWVPQSFPENLGHFRHTVYTIIEPQRALYFNPPPPSKVRLYFRRGRASNSGGGGGYIIGNTVYPDPDAPDPERIGLLKR